jgi:hypothetical protein
MEVTMLSIGLALGYWLRTSRLRSNLPVRNYLYRLINVSLMCLLAAFAIAMVISSALSLFPFAQGMTSAGGLLRSRLWAIMDHTAFSAFAAGYAAGFMLGDQQAGAETAALAAIGHPDSQEAGDIRSVFLRLYRLATAHSATIVAALLVVYFLVPPGFSQGLFGRIDKARLGGFEVSLQGGNRIEVAQAIRAANPANDYNRRQNTLGDRVGFIPQRLQFLQDLTYAPNAAPLPTKPDSADLGDRLDAIIFSQPVFPASFTGLVPPQPDGEALLPRSFRIQRDRAIIARILHARTKKFPSAAFWTLAADQEHFLASLAGHTSCISWFVEASLNRRLVEYQAYSVSESLLMLARYSIIAAGRGPQGRLPTSGTASDPNTGSRADPLPAEGFKGGPYPAWSLAESRRRSEGIRDAALSAFGQWVAGMSHAWNEQSVALDGLTRPYRDCRRIFVPHSEGRSEATNPPRAVPPPYLVYLAATVLSAMGDHGAAINILAQWLSTLENDTETSSLKGHTENSITLAWYRLTALIEILLQQRLSEGSENGYPVNLDGYKLLLQVRFPEILELISVSPNLQEISRAGACPDTAGWAWKQPIVASYLSWLQTYLDFRAERSAIQELTRQDLALAEMLSGVNINCLSTLFAKAPERSIERLRFIVSATNIKVNWLQAQPGGIVDLAERQKTLRKWLEELDLAIAAAPQGLAGSVGFSTATPDTARQTLSADLRKVIFGSREGDLITAATALRKTMASALGSY